MTNIEEAILTELFIDTYSKWRIGYYPSSKGLINIKDMAIPHIENAINMMIKARENRYNSINIMFKESEDTIFSEILKMYDAGEDIITIKINELQEELKNRKTILK